MAKKTKKSKEEFKIENVSNPHAIVGFEIQKLFGYIDYSFRSENPSQLDLARLTILYGLNGTGKTTILKLAYHLLSPQERKGHKTVLARTVFKKFRVFLLDGTSVWAERGETKLGTFILNIKRPKKNVVSHTFMAIDDPPRIPGDRKEKPTYDIILKELSEVTSSFFYLADDRTVNIEINEVPGARTSFDTRYFESYIERKPYHQELRVSEEISVAIVVALEAAIHSLHQWFSVQVNRLSSTGFSSAHSVYSQVIKQIASPAKRGPKATKITLDEQINKLLELASESKTFKKYGLSSELDTDLLVKILKNAIPSKKHTLSNVLTAYLEVLENRFNELRSIYKTIDGFIVYLNHFFNPKVAKFHLDEGLTLYAPNNKILEPNMLSSGERHLLLILCFTLLSSNRKALFIVDEPEISLNIIWQRKLIDSLLSISKNTEVQFLMASHSLHIVSSHMKNVIKLTLKK